MGFGSCVWWLNLITSAVYFILDALAVTVTLAIVDVFG